MARIRYTSSIAKEPAVADTMNAENSFVPKIGTNLSIQPVLVATKTRKPQPMATMRFPTHGVS